MKITIYEVEYGTFCTSQLFLNKLDAENFASNCGWEPKEEYVSINSYTFNLTPEFMMRFLKESSIDLLKTFDDVEINYSI